jgi:PPM family protein phosphatase
MSTMISFTERSASLTERGRRAVNQDAVLVAEVAGQELVAVADGMGGHAAGEIASRRALEVLREAIQGGATLDAAMRNANAAVYELAAARPELHGMGTTLVALLRRGPRYMIANVGDSRAYRVDRHGIHQLTRDHSFVAEASGSGSMSAEDAERSPWRNAVTRAIGTDRLIEVDCYGPFDATEDHTILLCTDGVYRAVPDDDLRRITLEGGQPEDAARDLLKAAFRAGSDDNISAGVVRFGAAVDPSITGSVPRAATDAAPRAVSTGGPMPKARTRKDRRGRSRRHGLAARWTTIETGAILLGVVAVMVYVFILRLMT